MAASASGTAGGRLAASRDRHVLTVTRYSQVANAASPLNRGNARHALTKASCIASLASAWSRTNLKHT